MSVFRRLSVAHQIRAVLSLGLMDNDLFEARLKFRHYCEHQLRRSSPLGQVKCPKLIVLYSGKRVRFCSRWIELSIAMLRHRRSEPEWQT